MRIDCKHLQDGKCLLLSKHKGNDVYIDSNFCLNHCSPANVEKQNETVRQFKPTKNKMPSKTQQLKNAVTATGKAIKSGFKRRNKEEQKRRFKICTGGTGKKKCEFLIDKILKRCSKCGCCVGLKKKLEAWHCPIDKW